MDRILMSLSIRLMVVLVIASAAITFCPSLVQAQASGIAISPSTFEPDQNVEPGEELQFELEIRNREDRDRTFFLTPRNISGVRDGGVPIFTRNMSDQTGYELADWISFGTDEIAVSANGVTSVSITLTVPEDAPPGSHFGGINVSSAAPELSESGAGISMGVTNIVTVRVAGDATEQATIRSLSTNRYLYSAIDVQFTSRIENEGNVLLRPVGLLEIKNMFGSEVAQIVVNDSQQGVFPGTTREFQFAWEDEGLGFGRYEAVLSMQYGSEGVSRTMTNTVSFWVLPSSILWPALISFLVLFLVVYGGVRWYVRRALGAHYGNARRVGKSARRRSGPSFLSLLGIVMLVVTGLFLLVLLLLFA